MHNLYIFCTISTFAQNILMDEAEISYEAKNLSTMSYILHVAPRIVLQKFKNFGYFYFLLLLFL